MTVDSANAFPEEESEFHETGLTEMPAVKIKVPRVAEVPIHLECKLNQVIELGPHRHPLVTRRGRVLPRRPRLRITNGYIDMRKLAPIGRLSGFQYVTLGDILDRRFEDGQPR
jgi:flavin reductase (DIM6/NTAB) family NADH-FMN oxidoreductase RutF